MKKTITLPREVRERLARQLAETYGIPVSVGGAVHGGRG